MGYTSRNLDSFRKPKGLDQFSRTQYSIHSSFKTKSNRNRTISKEKSTRKSLLVSVRGKSIETEGSSNLIRTAQDFRKMRVLTAASTSASSIPMRWVTKESKSVGPTLREMAGTNPKEFIAYKVPKAGPKRGLEWYPLT